MKTHEQLNDLENWTPAYQSPTWPTGSVLSPLFFALLVPAATAHSSPLDLNPCLPEFGGIVWDGGTGRSVVLEFHDRNDGQSSVQGRLESSQRVVDEALKGLTFAALAKVAFPQAREMEPWEKKATDSFFLSHFK